MNISNAAYHKPLTIYKPGIQREGYDPSREGEDPWYAPEEKVMPRVYHKYIRADILENIYGTKDDENDDPVEPIPEPEPEPEPVPEPTPVEP